MKKGFTLIELLVVALIIGILAAVALPQYQTAVLKSHFAAMIPLVKSLADAQEVYYLDNGRYSEDLTELGVSFPNCQPDASSSALRVCCQTVCYALGSHSVFAQDRVYGLEYNRWLEQNPGGGRQWCIVSLQSSKQDQVRKVCKTYGAAEPERKNEGYEWWPM